MRYHHRRNIDEDARRQCEGFAWLRSVVRDTTATIDETGVDPTDPLYELRSSAKTVLGFFNTVRSA